MSVVPLVEPPISPAHEKLRATVTGLLRSVRGSTITVAQVARAAGVTRPTVYAVYDDLGAAFADAALARLSPVLENVTLGSDARRGTRDQDMERAFSSVLTRLGRDAFFFRNVFAGPAGLAVQDRLTEYLAHRLRTASPMATPLLRGPLPATISSGAIAAAVVRHSRIWLTAPDGRSAGQVAMEIRELITLSVDGGLGGAIAPPSSLPARQQDSVKI